MYIKSSSSHALEENRRLDEEQFTELERFGFMELYFPGGMRYFSCDFVEWSL